MLVLSRLTELAGDIMAAEFVGYATDFRLYWFGQLGRDPGKNDHNTTVQTWKALVESEMVAMRCMKCAGTTRERKSPDKCSCSKVRIMQGALREVVEWSSWEFDIASLVKLTEADCLQMGTAAGPRIYKYITHLKTRVSA